MKHTHTFEADDGTTFATVAECKKHDELNSLLVLLSGLSPVAICDALGRIDTELAEAFERAGNIIANKRRDSGELKRVAKKQPGMHIGTPNKAVK